MPRNEMGIDQNRNRNFSESDATTRTKTRRGLDDDVEYDRGARVTTAMLRSNSNKTKSAVHNNSYNKKRGRLRHESDTDASDISATLECQKPPDGGWGWVVVAAAFLVNMIADGVTFSFGVFYVEFNKYFGESKAKTAWIGSLMSSLPLLSGPIASSLADRFGCRRVTIAGSLLATIGFVLSSYATSVEMLFLTFGVITGFGLSLCYVAAVVIVAYYFEERRSLATGLSVCGGGIGTFVFAPLTAELINVYGWRGTTLLLAGAFLNLSVCGFVFRDLEWTKNNVHKAHTPCVDLVPSEVSEITSMKNERLFNSAICIPTFVQEQEHQNFLQRTNFRTSVNLNFHSFHKNNHHHHHDTNNVTLNGVSSHHNFPNGDNLSCGVTSVTNGDVFNMNLSNASAPIKPNNNNLCNNNVGGVGVNHASITTNATFVPLSLNNNDGLLDMESTIASNNPLTSKNDSATNLMRCTTVLVSNNLTNQMPSQTPTTIQNYLGDDTWTSPHAFRIRHSLTYRGAVLSLKRYRLRPASSCPDIVSVVTADDARSTHEWRAVMEDVVKWLRGVCDWEHLSSSRFILFILSNLLLYMWYDVPYVYLQDAALQNNYSEDKSSYLISIVGFFNMLGNIMLGYMGDKPWTDAVVVYGVCMAVCGASIIVLPWCMAWNYASLAVGCALFGLTIAANYSLTSVILVKVVSLERFANAYGLLLLVQGIGNLTGPPIAGVIYDLTGTSSWSFLVAGGGVFASSVFILAPKLFNRRS